MRDIVTKFGLGFHTSGQTCRQTDSEAYRQRDIQTDIQTDMQTDIQTDRNTKGETWLYRLCCGCLLPVTNIHYTLLPYM